MPQKKKNKAEKNGDKKKGTKVLKNVSANSKDIPKKDSIALKGKDFKNLIELYDTPVIIINKATRDIAYVNKAALKLYGYTNKQFIHKKLSDLSPSAKSGKSLSKSISYHQTKDGRILKIKISRKSIIISKKEYLLMMIREANGSGASKEDIFRNAFFKEFIDTNPGAICLKDSKGRFVFINKQWASLFGITKSQINGKYIRDIWADINEAEIIEQEDKALLANEVDLIEKEEKIITPSGKKKYYYKIKKLVFDKTSSAKYVATIGVDITEQKLIEKEIIKNEKNYRYLIESNAEAMSVIQGKRYVMVNTAWEKLFGYTFRQAVSDKFDVLNIIARESRETFSDKLNISAPVMRVGSICEFSGLKSNTQKLDLESSFTDIIWNGAPAVLCITRDISVRKRTEEALKREAFIFDNLYDAIIISDLEGKILNWNEAASKMYGYSKEEVIDEPASMLNLNGTGIKITSDIISQVEKCDKWKGELEFVRKDGARRISETFVFPFKNHKGERIALVGVNRDITERKIAEHQLKASEERFRSIFDYSPISLWEEDLSEVKKALDELNANGVNNLSKYLHDNPSAVMELALKIKVIDINKATLLIYEAENKEQIKDNVGNILSGNGPNVFIEGICSLYNGKKYFEAEAANLTVKGRLININMKISVPQGYRESWSKVLVSIIDISERKKYEHELTESRQKYKELTDLLPQTVFEMNLEGRLTFVNETAFRVFQYTQQDFDNGLLVYDMIVPKDRGRAAANILKILKGERVGETEYLVTRKDGTIFPVLIFSNPVIRDGVTVGLRGILVDITERKQTEEQLLKLSRAVEQNPSSIVITDLFGDIEYVNPRFTELTGYTKKNALGKNPRFLKSGETSRTVYEDLWNTITKGNTWRGELHNKKKSGELYWEFASISPIVSPDGKISHFLAIKEDITQKKLIEKELLRAKEKAEESDRLKSEFLAQMSHEIRSPLNIIMSYNSLLNEELTPLISEDHKIALTSIDSAGKRLLRTIDLILNIAALQSGYIDIKPTSINLSEILQGLKKEFEYTASNKNLDLIFTNKIESGVIIGDEYIVSEIFENLIGNAIKYTHEGKVEIVLYENMEKKLCVDVQDTGIGISKEYMPKLFDPFSQEESGYSRKFEGNGLGLALVEKYVDLLGAKIKVESQKGTGTIFTIIFRRNQNI